MPNYYPVILNVNRSAVKLDLLEGVPAFNPCFHDKQFLFKVFDPCYLS